MKIERNADNINVQAAGILNILGNSGKNYIFGCGWMGQKFYDAVRSLGYPVEGFVVSRKDASEWNGVPILELGELENTIKQNNIFVALRDQELLLNEKLAQLFAVVCPITYPKDLTLIQAKYYLDYFARHKVRLAGDRIKLSDYEFVNPFQKADDYLLSFVYEAGDLVLPVLYDDYE